MVVALLFMFVCGNPSLGRKSQGWALFCQITVSTQSFINVHDSTPRVLIQTSMFLRLMTTYYIQNTILQIKAKRRTLMQVFHRFKQFVCNMFSIFGLTQRLFMYLFQILCCHLYVILLCAPMSESLYRFMGIIKLCIKWLCLFEPCCDWQTFIFNIYHAFTYSSRVRQSSQQQERDYYHE